MRELAARDPEPDPNPYSRPVPQRWIASGWLKTHDPWSRGKRVFWDVTVRDSFAPSYRGITRSAWAFAVKGERDGRAEGTMLKDLIFVQSSLRTVTKTEPKTAWPAEGP